MEISIWNILLIDDTEEDFHLLQGYLDASKQGSFNMTWISSPGEIWGELAARAFDLVIVADRVSETGGIELIQEAAQRGHGLPFIIIARQGSYEKDLQAMQAGAKDYLNLGELTPALLERSIRYAIEAHKSLQALSESEKRFYMATRAVNGVVYDWDLETNHIFRSDGLQQVIGFRPSEVTQMHGWWEKRVHPDDQPLVEKTVEEKIQGGAHAYELEYRVQHQAGYWIDVWEQAYILRDGEGKAYRVVGTRTDITDRKRGERNTRLLAELGEKMLTLKEPEALFSYASEALMRHLGLEWISFDLVDQQAQSANNLHERYLRQPLISGGRLNSPFHHELQKQMAKGQVMVIEDTSLGTDSADLSEASINQFGFHSFVAIPRLVGASWVGTMSVAVETPRRWRQDEVALLKQSSDLIWLAVENARLVKELREAHERFEIALRNSQMTIYTTDLERRYTWVANSLFHLGEGPVIGLRDEDIVDADDFRELIEAKKSVLASGVGIEKELKLSLDNRTIYIDMVIEPLRSEEGDIVGLIVAASDKTQRREIEERFQQTTNQLEIQRRMEQLREEERQQIARDLHDGPIQGMIGLLFSIKTIRSILDDQRAEEMLTGVQEDTQKLVNELRNLCNELRPPVLVQFGLSSAIRSHANKFMQMHPGIKVRLEISDAGRLLPDAVRLAVYRVYQEALNNVARHAQASEVTVSLGMVDSALQLEVIDNGVGFEMPGSLLNWAREGHFGLVGMQERVEAIGGTLKITPAASSGTRVRVQVPVAELVEAYN